MFYCILDLYVLRVKFDPDRVRRFDEHVEKKKTKLKRTQANA